MKTVEQIFEAAGVNVAILGNATDPKPSTDARKAEAQKLVPALKAGEIYVGSIVKYVAGLEGHKLAQQQFYALAGWKPASSATQPVKPASTIRSENTAPVLKKNITNVMLGDGAKTFTKAQVYLFEALFDIAKERDFLAEAETIVINRTLADIQDEVTNKIQREIEAAKLMLGKKEETPINEGVDVQEEQPQPAAGKKENKYEFHERMKDLLTAGGVVELENEDLQLLYEMAEKGNTKVCDFKALVSLYEANVETNKPTTEGEA